MKPAVLLVTPQGQWLQNADGSEKMEIDAFVFTSASSMRERLEQELRLTFHFKAGSPIPTYETWGEKLMPFNLFVQEVFTSVEMAVGRQIAGNQIVEVVCLAIQPGLNFIVDLEVKKD